MKFKRTSPQEALPPTVAAAMDALRPTPAPDRAVWEARRQTFLAEAREYAAQAVTPAPILRRKSWKSLFTFNPKEVPMKAFAKFLVALALIFSATAGTVSASQESLPGSVLYPVKMQYEDARLALTQAPATKALLAMAYAQERVDEAVELVERGDEVPEPLAARYQLQVGLALQTMEGLGEAQQIQLRANFSGTLQNQARVMAQVMTRLHHGENVEHPEPAQTMLKTMEQAQQALGYAEHYAGENETPGNVAAPGTNPDAHGNGLDNGGNGAGSGGENGGNGEGDGGENGGSDGVGKSKHHGGEDTGKSNDKGQNGDGGRPDDGGNPDNGNGGSDNGGNGEGDNGGSDNGDGGENGGSDNGGDGGAGENGGNGGGTGNGGNGGGSGGGGGN